jgi:sulfide:quinone oxidoreductase
VLKMGRVPYMLKMQYKGQLVRREGKVPDRGLGFAEVMTEQVFGQVQRKKGPE